MGTTCSPCQIVLAEDNPADVLLVHEALREHEVHCELRVIGGGEQVLSFYRPPGPLLRAAVSGPSPTGHVPSKAGRK